MLIQADFFVLVMQMVPEFFLFACIYMLGEACIMELMFPIGILEVLV
jgi:hypothetical protein